MLITSQLDVQDLDDALIQPSQQMIMLQTAIKKPGLSVGGQMGLLALL